MAGTTRVTVTLKVYGGYSARFVFHMPSTVVSPTDPLVAGLITVLEAITRGKAIEIEISLSAAVVGSVTSSPTYVNEDKAFMKFKDDAGVGHNFKIPGLSPAILLADNETVDASNADVVTFVAAVNTYARGRGGNDLTTFVEGYRKSARKLLKG